MKQLTKTHLRSSLWLCSAFIVKSQLSYHHGVYHWRIAGNWFSYILYCAACHRYGDVSIVSVIRQSKHNFFIYKLTRFVSRDHLLHLKNNDIPVCFYVFTYVDALGKTVNGTLACLDEKNFAWNSSDVEADLNTHCFISVDRTWTSYFDFSIEYSTR